MIDFNSNIQIDKIIKKKKNLLCFKFTYNNINYFGKLFTQELDNEYTREKNINIYLNKNIHNYNNFIKLLYYYDNITLNNNLLNYFDNNNNFNLLIFEYFNSKPLRYYINKLSKKNFNDIILQIKDATFILKNLNIIHYDLYCQTNVLLCKLNNKWTLKIIDFGLSYIDTNDNTNNDYNTLIESINDFNKKQLLI